MKLRVVVNRTKPGATELAEPLARGASRRGCGRLRARGARPAQERVNAWGRSPRAAAGGPAARQALPGASSNRDAFEGGPPEGAQAPSVRVRALERRGNASPR